MAPQESSRGTKSPFDLHLVVEPAKNIDIAQPPCCPEKKKERKESLRLRVGIDANLVKTLPYNHRIQRAPVELFQRAQFFVLLWS